LTRERLLDIAWGLVARGRNIAKRRGFLGGFERLLLTVGPRLIQPPKTAMEVGLAGGLRLSVPAGYPASRTLAAGIYEPEVSRLIRDSLQSGMTFVDLGANVGYYTLIGSRLVAPGGRVYAFEPDPGAFEQLCRNVDANHCTNVLAVPNAATEISGQRGFRQDPYGAEGFITERGSSLLSVEGVALDDFFRGQNWPRIDVIKLDIEGSETAALGGMRAILNMNHDLQLIMEYNSHALERAGSSPQLLAARLEDCGYVSGFIIEKNMKAFCVSSGLPSSRATYNLLLRRRGN
jgi:FkbM family methyltransferase